MPSQASISQAAKLWIGIVVIVLIVLFLETRDGSVSTRNFVVNTNESGIGATVLVDNRELGKVDKPGDSGLDGGVLWAELPDGHHTLDIKKDGLKPYTAQFDLHKEIYLGVDLEPSTN